MGILQVVSCGVYCDREKKNLFISFFRSLLIYFFVVFFVFCHLYFCLPCWLSGFVLRCFSFFIFYILLSFCFCVLCVVVVIVYAVSLLWLPFLFLCFFLWLFLFLFLGLFSFRFFIRFMFGTYCWHPVGRAGCGWNLSKQHFGCHRLEIPRAVRKRLLTTLGSLRGTLTTQDQDYMGYRHGKDTRRSRYALWRHACVVSPRSLNVLFLWKCKAELTLEACVQAWTSLPAQWEGPRPRCLRDTLAKKSCYAYQRK